MSEQQWQPISTAPSDRSPVWVWGDYLERPIFTIAEGEHWRWCRYSGYGMRIPTHWMPADVPAPPIKAGSAPTEEE